MVSYLQEHQHSLGLDEAQLYYDSPILKDADDNVVIAKVLLLSPNHGVILLATRDIGRGLDQADVVVDADADLEHVFWLVYSKLIRNRQLRRYEDRTSVRDSYHHLCPESPRNRPKRRIQDCVSLLTAHA